MTPGLDLLRSLLQKKVTKHKHPYSKEIARCEDVKEVKYGSLTVIEIMSNEAINCGRILQGSAIKRKAWELTRPQNMSPQVVIA